MSTRVLTLAIFNEATRWTLPEPVLQRIRELAPDDVEVRLVGERRQLLAAMGESDYLAGFPFSVPQFLATDCKHIRWIQLTGRVGESSSSMHKLLAAGVRVSSAAPIRAPQCAEHAVLLSLALLRGLPASLRAQMEHRWAAEEIGTRAQDMAACVVGVIGDSVVGERVARAFAPFGCELLVASKGNPDAPPSPERPWQTMAMSRLDELLSVADVVVLADPFPERTSPIVRRAQLQSMKPSAFLVDVSRPGLVEERDVVLAIQREEIAGAGLDVFEHEPPSPDSPLWTMPNVILTPQVSGVSPAYWAQAGEVIGENLRRIERGEDLLDEIPAEIPAPAGKRR